MSIDVLHPAEFEQLAALEARVLAADGVRLKLEWSYIRTQRTVASLVWREGDTLCGFLGLYAFGGPPNVELVGMVDPDHRRRRVATRLLERAEEICEAEGLHHRLVVTPRESAAAVALLRGLGAELEHSEYSLALDSEPRRVTEIAETSIRAASEVDRPDRMRILTAGFGPPSEAQLNDLGGEHVWNVMIEHAGVAVGVARLSLDGERGVVGGFAIDPEYRGRGIGRDALGRFCTSLRERGALRVELQVEVENDRALGLYESTGFAPVSTEDYYRLRGPAVTSGASDPRP